MAGPDPTSPGSLVDGVSGTNITEVLEIRRLQIFAAVAEHGSFTAAAEALFLTHSAVSQQMALLERQLGVALVVRGPRGVELTEAGKLLAERGTAVLGTLQAIEREVTDLRTQPASVRLGAFPTAGGDLIPRAVQMFRSRHPHTAIELRSARAADMPAFLRDGSVHLGLVWDYDFLPRTTAPDLEWLHLADDPLCMLLPDGHPHAGGAAVSLADFAAEQWVVRGHHAPYDEAFGILCRLAGFEPEVGFVTEDYLSAQGLVAAGIGVSVAPRLALVAVRPGVTVVPLADPAPRRRIGTVRLRQAVHPPAAHNLLEILRDVAR